MTIEAPRLTVPGPIWGATYTLSLICPHQGVNINCGTVTIAATVDGCNPNLKPCTSENIGMFLFRINFFYNRYFNGCRARHIELF